MNKRNNPKTFKRIKFAGFKYNPNIILTALKPDKKTLDNLEIEIEFYKKHPELLEANKKFIKNLYGTDGLRTIRKRIIGETAKKLAWKAFKAEVWRLTELNDLSSLENFDKRGFKDYHVDHITSIWRAFKDGWTPEKCAHISNLQMLPFYENMKKGTK